MTSYICDCNINWRLWLEEDEETLSDSDFVTLNKSQPLSLHPLDEYPLPHFMIKHAFATEMYFLFQLLPWSIMEAAVYPGTCTVSLCFYQLHSRSIHFTLKIPDTQKWAVLGVRGGVWAGKGGTWHGAGLNQETGLWRKTQGSESQGSRRPESLGARQPWNSLERVPEKS